MKSSIIYLKALVLTIILGGIIIYVNYSILDAVANMNQVELGNVIYIVTIAISAFEFGVYQALLKKFQA